MNHFDMLDESLLFCLRKPGNLEQGPNSHVLELCTHHYSVSKYMYGSKITVLGFRMAGESGLNGLL